MMFSVSWLEDTSHTILGRVTARNGSGAATGVNGEGNFLQQADVSTIERSVFDLDGGAPNTPITGFDATSLTVSDVILDTVVTAQTIWTKDTTGYNFIDDLSSTAFATGGRRYRVEYVFTLTGGEKFYAAFEGQAEALRAT